MEWENILANDLLDKGLVSKTYKEHPKTQHPKLNTQKANNPVKKWAKYMNRHFSKGHPDGQPTYEKILNITHNQENTN